MLRPDSVSRRLTKVLLACGILYGVTYVVANDVVAALIYGDYDPMDQAVSELSAKGAVSRPFLVGMFAIWAPTLIAFGAGVWRAAYGNRYVRITGALLMAWGVIGLMWLPFPMTPRQDVVVGAAAAPNDVGHIVMSGAVGVFVLAEMTSAAIGRGGWFRTYSFVSAAVVLVFGMLTGTQAPNVAQGQPTPWMGFYERVDIGAWMLWMTVLAVVLWRDVNARASTGVSRPGVARAA